MRLDNERPSVNVEDRRGQGGFGNQGGLGRGFGFPNGSNGRGINIPIGSGRGGLSISTIIVVIVIYFAIKLLSGVDLLEVVNGGSIQAPRNDPATEITVPSAPIGTNAN
jgi:uncharacterized protein